MKYRMVKVIALKAGDVLASGMVITKVDMDHPDLHKVTVYAETGGVAVHRTYEATEEVAIFEAENADD